MIVSTGTRSSWSTIGRWSWTATKLNIRSCLFNFFEVIKSVLSWTWYSALLHWRWIESIFMAEFRRLNIIEFANIVHIVRSWTRDCNRVRLIIEFQSTIHSVVFDSWTFIIFFTRKVLDRSGVIIYLVAEISGLSSKSIKLKLFYFTYPHWGSDFLPMLLGL